MLWQSGWQITAFSHKSYIFGFHLPAEAILKVKSTCKTIQQFYGRFTCKFYFDNGF